VKILAFDTATRATTVAFASDDEVVIEARDDPPAGRRPNHVTRLLGLIEDVLQRAGTGWPELDKIAVGTGPGTFTGLRIGIATARALARAAGLPLVGVSTLRSLALNAPREQEGVVLAVLDARRGEVFAAGWRACENGPAVPEPQALAPAALGEVIASLPAPVLAIGDGAVEFRAILERSGASIPEDDSELHRVTAINHCRLARRLHGSAPDEVQPEYLRIPDAEITRRAARRP
jgi:tRNA threonylcarbamoyladenosine biosynthesis protein TsaB